MATRVVDLGSVKGPQGPKGDTGPQGPQGPAGPGGKRTARFVVGTSTAGWTTNDCDYLCDGVADQVEINAAIAALPAGGGEVVLLDGSYDLTGSITMNKANVTLRGNGTATKLGDSAHYIGISVTGNDCSVLSLWVPHIYIGGSRCKVMGITLVTEHDVGIDVGRGGGYHIIVGNYFDMCGEDLEGCVYVDDALHCVIVGNVCKTSDGWRGVYVNGNGNILAGNV